MRVDWKKYIVSTPDVLRGKPRLKDTRIPVSLVLGYLAAGHTHAEILQEFPMVTQADCRVFGLRANLSRI